MYAIINIILGTNLSGDEKACLINKKQDAYYGELHFTDNQGKNHILIRGKHRIDNKKNFISLDGKMVTQADLSNIYKDKKLFLSIINPLYFLNKKPAEQKEMVDKYLSEIKPFEIFNTLNEEQKKILLDKYYKAKKPFEKLNLEEQQEFINENILNICMDIAYNNLSSAEKKALEGMPIDIPSYIQELNLDIKNVENSINIIDGKIEYAQNIANEKVDTYKLFDKDEEISLAEQELSYLKSSENIVDKEKQKQVVTELEKDILNKETEFNELDTEMKSGKKKYLEIKSGETCKCPTCGQYIQDESRNTTISNMYKDLMSKYNKKNLLETQLKELKLKMTKEKCKYYSLEGETTIEKSKRIAIVEENIKQLKQEKQEVDKFNNEISIKEKNIQNAKLDIDKFNREKQDKVKFIDNLNEAKKVAQKLYISYIEEKMKIAKKYLKDVNIKFYSVLKTTGEIKEDFIITYKNNPLSDLSKSERVATSLEFANMFNKIAKTSFPIFIDDTESCADYDFIKEYQANTQLLISKVEMGTALRIANYNNKEQFTVIKPRIVGFKTIRLYNKTKGQLRNVA